MAALSGSLEDFGLTAILGLLARSGKSGRLRISQADWVAELSLRDGKVVAASFGTAQGLGGSSSGALRGLAAVEALVLLLPAAAFFFAEGMAPSGREIHLDGHELEATLARLEEERSTWGGRLPSPSVVPSRVPPSEQPADEQIVLDRGKLSLLLAVDGRRSVAELAGEMGFLRTCRDLIWLADHNLVRLPAAPAESTAESHTRAERTFRRSARTGLASS
jgi:hypothetical protein